MAPTWARCCRSTGCGGGLPGRAECSTRFLMQPVMPEENLPPVSTATSGAPPAGGEGGPISSGSPGRGSSSSAGGFRGPQSLPRPVEEQGPNPARGLPSRLTNVDAALGVDRHVRAWGLADHQFLSVHLDGASLALSASEWRSGPHPRFPVLPSPVRVPSFYVRGPPPAPRVLSCPPMLGERSGPTHTASEHPTRVSPIPWGARVPIPPPGVVSCPGSLCSGW